MKKRILQLLRNPLISASAVIVFLFSMYAVSGFYPFGEKCISWCDMDQQVVPLMMNLKDMLAGRDGFFLSMGNAGGMNFWGVFYFFLASPFSLLVALVPKADMMSFMNVMVALKMAAAAATACLFFDRHCKRGGSALGVALGFAYGVCGYAMLYYQNIIWLDMMYLFPLLALSLERLYVGEKPLMYTIMLALSVAVNYYIGYMIVVYVLLASGAFLLLRVDGREKRRAAAARFALSSACAALLSAPVWLPSILQISQSARSVSLLVSLSQGGLTGYYQTTWPLLYCTPLIFAGLFFLSRRRRASSDAAQRGSTAYWLAIFVMTVAPLFLEPINKMWQTGNYMSFPYRYGFIAVFAGLVLAERAVEALYDSDAAGASSNNGGADSNNGGAAGSAQPVGNARLVGRDPKTTVAGIVIGAYATAAMAYTSEVMLRNYDSDLFIYTHSLWGTDASFRLLSIWFAMGVAVFLTLFLTAAAGKLSRRMLTTFICIMLASIGVFNFKVYMGSISQDASRFKNAVSMAGTIEDDGFYRVKVSEKLFEANMMGAIGYGSLGHYTSLTNEEYMFAMKKLGYSSYWMEVNSDGGTFFSDALLSNNYVMTWTGRTLEGRPIVSGAYDIYKNEAIFPAALFSAADPATLEKLPEGERIPMQDELFKTLFNASDWIFTKLSPEEDGADLHYSIMVEDARAFYFDCFDELSNRLKEPINDSYRVMVNNRVVAESYPAQMRNGLLYLGTFEYAVVDIRISVKKQAGARSFGVYGLDVGRLAEAASSAAGTGIEVKANAVSVTYDAPESGWLYLPIPYSDGYHATLNGRQIRPLHVLDAFMAVEVAPGENEIIMRFVPPGLASGIALLICGAALTVAFAMAGARGAAMPQAAAGVVYAGVAVVIAAVFIAVYIFPVAYNMLT